MTMNNPYSFSRPARPAYLDGLFGTTQAQYNGDRPRTPSLSRSHHSSDSIPSLASSCTNSKDYSTRPLPSPPRALSPALEEEVHSEFDWDDEGDNDDDAKSTRTLLRPRLKLRTSLPLLSSKRAPPKQQQPRPNSGGSIMSAPSPLAPESWTHERKDSGAPSCAAPPPPAKPVNKPLPALPMCAQMPPQPRELNSLRCYYFAARNCKGWVMGGKHGDACDTCCQAGHFGAP